MEVGFHGAQRSIGERRDLVERAVGVEAQHDNTPLRIGQPLYDGPRLVHLGWDHDDFARDRS